MDRLAIIRNFINTQNNIISNTIDSTQHIAVVLQGGGAASQEILRQERKRRQKKPPKQGGSRKGRAPNIRQDFEAGYQLLYKDYFSKSPRYPDYKFRRRFRMHRSLFLKIVNDIEQHNVYFTHRANALGNFGLRGIQKITAAL
ncbi:hypothetical protein PTTG_08402 [Puccinia triticina 1-1 BBBD Race 1]|uniref:Uncharacterized protein n=1 Tax=Puccinia triticina (isolate 1-1 / race 1 (BBBD)) TaxID=630390 RepID=A0A180H2B2_PUCT1|nr:hypothetical protein PTTG_08402 [Puccinia triticina 1-1 BBBD Race 1]